MRFQLIITAVLSAASGFSQDALVPGSTVERPIDPGQVHSYRLPVRAGQFVHVTAAQLGSDVWIRLIQPDGARFTTVDRLPYESYEDLPWIASADGDCTIEIRTPARSRAGRYRLEVAVRAPTEQDRSRAAAFIAAWIEATPLSQKRTAPALREAVAKYDAAIEGFQKAGDRRWEAYAWSERARVLQDLNEFRKALESVERSLTLRRDLGERSSLSISLNGVGRMLSVLGESQRSLEAYQECLEIRRQIGDRVGEAVVLTNMGMNYKRLSNYEKAIECLTAALAIRKEIGDPPGESVTLGALGDVHFVAGDFQAALERYTEAWKLRVGKPDRKSEANAALNLGNVYLALGNSAQAHLYWKQAESIFREFGETQSLAGLLYARGMDDSRRGDHQAALASLEEALALHRKIAMTVATVNDLNALCGEALAAGKTDQAQAHAAEGIELSRKSEYKGGLGSSLACIGRLELAKSDYDGARTHFLEALDLFRASSNRENKGLALGGLAEVERRRGNLVEALRYTEEMNQLIEAGRVQVHDPALRASYRASQAHRVDFETGLLMEMHARDPRAGYSVRAFNLVERWRARSLTEMIAESSDQLRQELTPVERQREDRMLAAIAGIQRELFREGVPAPRQQDLKQKLSTAERDLDLFQTELRRGGNRYAAGQYAEVLDAERIRRQMLDPETAVIEYALGDTESYAWALTTTDTLAAVLPARKEIEQRVAAYRKLLSEHVTALTVGTALARLDTAGRELYRMLVSPFEASLGAKKRLIIVPDGALDYLPFEALAANSRMIERFSISYIPSASSLAALREREHGRAKPQLALLAFADPMLSGSAPTQLASLRERGYSFTALPNAREEVAGIRSLFAPRTSHVYLGAEASELSLRNEHLESYRFVHFAAHGYFDEEQPLRSGIVLAVARDAADDGMLQAPEIMRLRLNADIVTLSACQSGLGQVLAGEGVMGLTRAFFYAGAQSLVVSLWNVNDAATSELMKRFYGNLKAGMARDEALRRAKLTLMRTPGSAWRHPYYWAPFVFVGDAGASVK